MLQTPYDIVEDRKNRNFTQVYHLGFERMRLLTQEHPRAAALYMLFAEHIDAGIGAVLCDHSFLAEEFSVSTRTIGRWVKYLEETGALVKIPVAGRVCAYALNPNEVWKGYDTSKDYAAFATKTLVNKDGKIARRLKLLATGQQDLPLDEAN